MNGQATEDEKRSRPVRVVHLSDIHLGRKKRTRQMWECTRSLVVSDKPDLIVVSGDFVQHPSPLSLLLAWLEVRKFAADLRVSLFVIPGNHDVAFLGWGWFRFWPFTRFFDLIFTESCYQYFIRWAPTYSEFRDKHWAKRFFWRIRLYIRLLFKFPFLRPDRNKDGLWRLAYNPSVSDFVHIVGMDSNRSFFLAAGKVSEAQLDELTINTLQHEHHQGCAMSLVSRVLVVHHHPVPIPYCGESLSSFEPFLVLREAGTLLSQAALNDFDLIVHGHRHVRSFSHLAYTVRNQSQRSLAVLAAASPTAADIDSTTRSYNLLEFHRNGRILVRERFTGLGHTPAAGQGQTDFIEAIPLVEIKRRAFERAHRIQRMECESFVRRVSISQLGTTNQKMQILNMQVQGDLWPFTYSHRIAVNPGFVDPMDFRLDKEFSTQGVTLDVGRAPTCDEGQNVPISAVDVTFTVPTGTGTSLGITYKTANNFYLSQWECQELNTRDEEFVGMRVRFPTRRLEIDVELPESHRDVKPYLVCRRVPEYPLVQLEPGTRLASFPEDLSSYIYDPDMTWMEKGSLEKISERCWRLVIEFPPVGYSYEVRWPVSDARETTRNISIEGQTRVIWAAAVRRREQFLRSDSSAIPPSDTFSLILKALLAEFRQRFESNDPIHETVRLCFLSYQGRSLTVSEPRVIAVREVIAGPNPESIPLKDYWMPLGEGAAGLTFKTANPTLHCELAGNVPRGHGSPLFSLASNLKLQGVLALPVFQPRAWARLQSQREPGRVLTISDLPSSAETIGVITYASDCPGTGLLNLYDHDADVGVRGQTLTLLEILDVVQRTAPALEKELLA